MSSGFFEMVNFIISERKTERFQLLINLFRKFRAANFSKTWIVFDDWRFENLPAVAGIFKQKNFLVVT